MKKKLRLKPEEGKRQNRASFLNWMSESAILSG